MPNAVYPVAIISSGRLTLHFSTEHAKHKSLDSSKFDVWIFVSYLLTPVYKFHSFMAIASLILAIYVQK
jgi:hypothetical protein